MGDPHVLEGVMSLWREEQVLQNVLPVGNESVLSFELVLLVSKRPTYNVTTPILIESVSESVSESVCE